MKFAYLFEKQKELDPSWEATKNQVNASINTLLEKNSKNKDVLLLMKELLDECKPVSMEDYGKE